MGKNESVRVAFLDRDGVINRKKPEGEYVGSWEEFVFLPGALEAIKKLREGGWLVVVVTNQRCVARGIVTEEALESIHEKMFLEIERAGGAVHALYCCPHEDSDRCGCRKPRPGMILRAVEELSATGLEVDREKCFIVGDSLNDILAGRAAGIRTVKVAGYAAGADAVYKDLLAAVDAISPAW